MSAGGCVMRDLTTVDAAKRLGVPPNMLRLWEQRHGFPTSVRRPGTRRSFDSGEVMRLRAALGRETSIMSAIAQVRAELASDSRSVDGISAMRGDPVPWAVRAD